MNNYYTKYIKYKSKYLELKGYRIDSISNGTYQTKYIKEKGQIGGVGKPCNEALQIDGITIATILSEYDCNFDQINQSFTRLLEQFKFDYKSFVEINKGLSKPITIRNLLEKKFPVEFLLKRNFPITELKEAGITIEDYIREDIYILTILQDFTLEELTERYYAFIKEKLLELMNKRDKYLVICLKDAKINISIVDFLTKLKFTIKDLIDAGFKSEEIIAAGIHLNIGDLLYLNYNAEKFKEARITINDIVEFVRKHNKEVNLQRLGYTLDDLYRANIINHRQLKGYGFDFKSITDFITKLQEQISVDRNELKALGYNAYVLKELGYSASYLKEAGFSVTDLINAGFDMTYIIYAKFSATDFKDAGFSAAYLKNRGCDAYELKEAGFNVTELKDAGYNVNQLNEFTILQLKNAGFTTTEFKQAGINATKLKGVGFSAIELKEGGFSANELVIAKFSIDELTKAGFDVEEIKLYSAINLKGEGKNAKQLKDIGFSAAILREAGFSADGLVIAGFNKDEITKAGFNIDEITIIKEEILANIPKMEYNLAELIKRFSIPQLKGFGISAKQFKELKVSATKLINAGFTVRELINVGYSVQQFQAAGVTAAQLKQLGFDIKDLKDLFNNQQLKDAGFNKDEFVRIRVSREDFDKLK